jgi:hypothetical protein
MRCCRYRWPCCNRRMRFRWRRQRYFDCRPRCLAGKHSVVLGEYIGARNTCRVVEIDVFRARVRELTIWASRIDLGSCGDGEQQRERQGARTLSGLGRKHVLCYGLRSLPRMQAPCFMPMGMCALFALPHRHDNGIRKACALHPFELNPHQSQSRSLTIGGVRLATHSHNRAVV